MQHGLLIDGTLTVPPVPRSNLTVGEARSVCLSVFGYRTSASATSVEIECAFGPVERLAAAIPISAGGEPDEKVQGLESRMRCASATGRVARRSRSTGPHDPSM